jgi:hypothetical protein
MEGGRGAVIMSCSFQISENSQGDSREEEEHEPTSDHHLPPLSLPSSFHS